MPVQTESGDAFLMMALRMQDEEKKLAAEGRAEEEWDRRRGVMAKEQDDRTAAAEERFYRRAGEKESKLDDQQYKAGFQAIGMALQNAEGSVNTKPVMGADWNITKEARDNPARFDEALGSAVKSVMTGAGALHNPEYANNIFAAADDMKRSARNWSQGSDPTTTAGKGAASNPTVDFGKATTTRLSRSDDQTPGIGRHLDQDIAEGKVSPEATDIGSFSPTSPQGRANWFQQVQRDMDVTSPLAASIGGFFKSLPYDKVTGGEYMAETYGPFFEQGFGKASQTEKSAIAKRKNTTRGLDRYKRAPVDVDPYFSPSSSYSFP